MRMLAALVAALTLSGVVTASGEPPPEKVVFPTDRVELVARYMHSGGLLDSHMSWLMAAPTLLVYSDGLVVADADHTMWLNAEELTRLVRGLRQDFAHRAHRLNSRDARGIEDGGITELAVRLGNGSMHSVWVNQLGLVNDYPHALERADHRLHNLLQRANRATGHYTSGSVRLVLVFDPSTEPAGQSWPATLSEPPTHGPQFRGADLDGDAAQAVMTTMRDHAWPTRRAGPYRLADGSVWQAYWRYLAPDEQVGTEPRW